MKTIKLAIWFIKNSKTFLNKSTLGVITDKGFIKALINFVRSTKHDEKMVEKYGIDGWYARMDKTIEF